MKAHTCDLGPRRKHTQFSEEKKTAICRPIGVCGVTSEIQSVAKAHIQQNEPRRKHTLGNQI